jgi:hypothetical protein
MRRRGEARQADGDERSGTGRLMEAVDASRNAEAASKRVRQNGGSPGSMEGMSREGMSRLSC